MSKTIKYFFIVAGLTSTLAVSAPVNAQPSTPGEDIRDFLCNEMSIFLYC